MDKKELAKKIYERSHFNGYFDEYLFESDPKLLVAIAKEMKSLIPEDTEVVAGIELGGIPLVTAVSIETGIVSAFVRKKPKKQRAYNLFARKEAKDHRKGNLAEGAEFKGKNVCIIEDVVTKGEQMIKSVHKLRSGGAKIECVVCVIQKKPEAIEILKKEGLCLRPVFTMEDIKHSE